MLLVLVKASIVFLLVLFCVRLMGKRQLGEMQPFELVITLVIADLACIPINDPYVPFYTGIVPIITLTFLHIIISLLCRKSIALRKIISGSSIIVIDKNGVVYKNLKRLNMNMNDLLEAIHANGHIDINKIEYAIFETNGKICIVERTSDPTKPDVPLLPLTLIMDGKWNAENLEISGLKPNHIEASLKKNNIKNLKEVLYMDIRQDGTAYVAPKQMQYFTVKLNPKGDW